MIMVDKQQMLHANMVEKLTKSPEQILNTLSSIDVGVMHMLMGISGEAGEIVDTLKKTIIYNKTLDREHIIEELGDLEYYLEGLRQLLHITRDECLSNNVQKLSTRYPGFVYSDIAAVTRADKQD